LSQLGKRWPTKGRVIGIIADSSSDAATVAQVRDQVAAGQMLPLVVSATGGSLGDGTVTVDRTYLTTRSVEFDAVLVAGAPAPGDDATGSIDAKAGNPPDGSIDPRVTQLLDEAYRHAKAIGGWGGAGAAFQAAGFSADDAGVVAGDDPSAVLAQVVDLVAEHRVWDRFAAVHA
jgi:catalase